MHMSKILPVANGRDGETARLDTLEPRGQTREACQWTCCARKTSSDLKQSSRIRIQIAEVQAD
jgi:hypothetical protein